MPSTCTTTKLIVSDSKQTLPSDLAGVIAPICEQSIQTRGAFTLALSGGSLPDFLSTLETHFKDLHIDPKFDCWHVLLADERCVPEDNEDSNMGAIRKTFLRRVGIPEPQIHGIATDLLDTNDKESTNKIAQHYEATLHQVLKQSGGRLDLALLGFGPDGHTCSLFPNHELLQERTRWVAPIVDSPKPPCKRITLTLPMLNQETRHVIVCGAGESKGPILGQVVASLDSASTVSNGPLHYGVTLSDPPPFPCAMVRPAVEKEEKCSLTWLVDKEAFQAANLT